jgi:hypothetical protein
MRDGYELDELIAELLPIAEATSAELERLSGADFDRALAEILATTDVVLGLYPDATKPSGMSFQLIKGARVMMLVLARKRESRVLRFGGLLCRDEEEALAHQEAFGDGVTAH